PSLARPPSAPARFPSTTLFRSLDRRVRANYPDVWQEDLTGAFLAATYQLLHQDALAGSLIGAAHFGRKRKINYAYYDDDLTHDADRKSTRLNSSHQIISYAVFC